MGKNKDYSYKTNEDVYGFLMHFLMLVLGFLSSTAAILGGMLPFGVSFVSAVPKKYLSASVFGVSVGYLLFITKGGFVYISAVFAVSIIKLILGDAVKPAKSPAFFALITFLILTVTGIVMTVSYDENILLQSGQAVISAVAAYFEGIVLKLDFTSSIGFDIREIVSVLFFISIILLSLYRFNIIGLNIGRILATSFILASARFGKASYGAVSGAVIGFTLALFDGNLYSVSALFPFSGLMSGLFSPLGSLGIVGAYLTSDIVSLLLLNNLENFAVLFFEALIGCGIFLTVPSKIGITLRGILSPPSEITNPDVLKNALVMRLEFAGGALKDIFETVEDVAAKLKKIHSPDFEKTLTEVEGDVCGGCSLRKHCWETAKEITAEDALRLWGRIKSGADETEVPLKKNCLRYDKFKTSVENRCAEYDARQKADRRISEVRGVISDQFSAISNMLFDLCDEFKFEVHHDLGAAENIILTMKNLGFHTVNCMAYTDKLGHLSADIHIKGAADKTLNKMELVKHISLALNKDIETPSVTISNDEAFISITERQIFKVEIGISQIPEEKGKLCGDSYKYFTDGKGKFIIVLSDGMGTGGRAAVDSAMVTGLMNRMICSGFGYDCSLKIINSSMLFKSTDESLATVDIATIDLFTGECELRKAGAAPTLIRKKGKVGKAESSSLPPGILRNVAFDIAKVKLKSEDIVVMFSDGAATEGTKWISEMIAEVQNISAQQLADDIALAARRRRNDGHNDDITVITAVLKDKM